MRTTYLFLGAILLLAALYLFSTTSDPGKAAVPATDIAIADVNGHNRVVRLSELKGKVVLIDLWATWCGPCRMSIPGIQKLYSKHHAKGFEVMGVALEKDSGSELPGFFREMKMTYPAGLPTDAQQVGQYTSGNIPQMILIDRKGHIAWKPPAGFSPELEVQLGEQVENLLKQ